ncbi:protein-L-isoaspartate(D-aspartate) O-methyltransferase [Aminobacter sp. HY435]|uniref:protein-L-isoaspartate(D-aspartate) O-methyltransferase n=1 Tax=Aminobacter sp. HY435 TaxID=2970917 RepID=UPI0022B973FD|nr:protein-L-isoaspartate(D-aspartate) O-methyltransferase [Aminobacter sp. HY435]
MSSFKLARLDMVEQQIVRRGIVDLAVLQAMRSVPREDFVPPPLRRQAYDDTALPIEAGQTISQPYIVALMISAAAIRPGSKVLEIGAGSGYAAAVLSGIAGKVVTIERIAKLAEQARARLRRLRYRNVEVITGDGAGGHPEQAPYDAILSAAGARSIPEAWKDQLAIGGRLVMPLGPPGDQQLIRLVRVTDSEFAETSLAAVRFVPLLGGTG